MCVIAYKPLNVAFPEERILRNCFENNDDGAGFMFAYKGEVHFHKGYETFSAFMKALNAARKITGDNVPYVMHFRIATQGYEKTMTHPFPLSSNMNSLKKLRGKCSIGIAHNGILDITSDGSKTYSDTMLFITDYLSNIIQGYDWYENKRTKKLIEKLIDGSRLAILDAKGHCELMGKGWVKDGDMHYSNSSYAREPIKWPSRTAGFYSGHWNDDWWDDGRYAFTPIQYAKSKKQSLHSSGTTAAAERGDNAKSPSAPQPTEHSSIWEFYYDTVTKKYWFDESYCPKSVDNLDTYCANCANCAYCSSCNTQKVLELKQVASVRV